MPSSIFTRQENALFQLAWLQSLDSILDFFEDAIRLGVWKTAFKSPLPCHQKTGGKLVALHGG
jgi:hypothetical protein